MLFIHSQINRKKTGASEGMDKEDSTWTLCASLRWHYPGQVRRAFSHPKTFNSSGPLAWPNGNTKEEADGMAFLLQVAANFADLNRGQQNGGTCPPDRQQLIRLI